MASKTKLIGAILVVLVIATSSVYAIIIARSNPLIEANVRVSVTVKGACQTIRESGADGVLYALANLLDFALFTLKIQLPVVAQLLVSTLSGLLNGILSLLGYTPAVNCTQPPLNCTQLANLTQALNCNQSCPAPNCTQLDGLNCTTNCSRIDCNQIADCGEENDCSPLFTCKPTNLTEDDTPTVDELRELGPAAFIVMPAYRFDPDGPSENNVSAVGILIHSPNTEGIEESFSFTYNDQQSDPIPSYVFFEVTRTLYAVYNYKDIGSDEPCSILLTYLDNIPDDDCGYISIVYVCILEGAGCLGFGRGSGELVAALVYQTPDLELTDACYQKAEDAIAGLADRGFNPDPNLVRLSVDLTSHLFKFDDVTAINYTNPRASGIRFVSSDEDTGVYSELFNDGNVYTEGARL